MRVFISMRTQWRTGMGGPTGLDYTVLPEMWRRLKVPHDERDAIFHDLQLLEIAALSAIHAEES